MAFNKITDKLLSKSNSYNFYKEQYESDFNKRILEIERMLDVHQEFLNNLFIYHEFEPTPYLAGMRNLSYELLKFVENVCKKYELEWWIDYGTLLGAVRHGDFVPWDDDLDSGMMREDYNKFIDIIPKEIEENNLEKVIAAYKLDRTDIQTKRWYQVRYQYPGFKNTFTTVDIFPYDYIKNYNNEDIKDDYYDCIRNYYNYPKDHDMSDYMQEVFEKLNLTLDRDEYIIAGVENVRGRGIPRVTMYPYKIFETKELFPLKKTNFGKYDYPVPNDSVTYLKNIYGNNYLMIPKKVRDHKRLNRFIQEENILEMLQEGIDMLQKANENLE